jgi:hypothetical protein
MMIRLSSKKIMISTCLMLVLASGIIIQIAGQSTYSVTVCLDVTEGPRLELLINDKPFCVDLSSFEAPTPSLSPTPNDESTIMLTGDVYEGKCNDAGSLFGTFTGTLKLINGTSEGKFMAIIDFTVTGTPTGTLHSQSKFTGNLVAEDSIGFRFENMESEYAYFEIDGTRVNLILIGLEPESGAVMFEENEVTLFCLPTFIFTIEAPVGGILIPIDKLAVLTPSLVLAGLIAVVSTMLIKKRK